VRSERGCRRGLGEGLQGDHKTVAEVPGAKLLNTVGHAEISIKQLQKYPEKPDGFSVPVNVLMTKVH